MQEFIGSPLYYDLRFCLFAFMGIMMGSLVIIGTVGDWCQRAPWSCKVRNAWRNRRKNRGSEADAGEDEPDWKICSRIAINTYNAGECSPRNEDYENGWAAGCNEVMKRIDNMFSDSQEGS